MKHHKITRKRLEEFTKAYDTDIMFLVFLLTGLAALATMTILSIGSESSPVVCLFTIPLSIILLWLITSEIQYLISSYRWYFGIPKNNKKKNTKQ